MDNLHGCKILVAEDEPELRQMLAEFLERDGAAVRCVGDGAAALEEARCWSPDLLLFDIRMPKRDGLSVLVDYRVIDPNTPTILITALGDDADRLAGFRLGADDYLVKPYNPLEVVARVRAVLRRRKRDDNPGDTSQQFFAGRLRLERFSRRVFNKCAGQPLSHMPLARCEPTTSSQTTEVQ